MSQVQPKPTSKIKILLLTAVLIGAAVGGQKLYSEYKIRTPQLAVGTCLADTDVVLDNGVKTVAYMGIDAIEGKRLNQVYKVSGFLMVPLVEGLAFPFPIEGEAPVEMLQRAMKEKGNPIVINCDTGEPIGK